MRAYERFTTVRQMGVGLGVFVALSLVLESGALYDWAQRLELGPERTVAMPVATVLHRAMAPLGIETLRSRTLVELARVGWSDDPAAVAAAKVVEKPVVAVSSVAAAAPASVAPPVVVKPLHLAPVGSQAPPMFSVLPKIDAVDAGETRKVALVGDSMMAVGLSSTILHEAPKYKDLTFVSVFKSGTGLARPEVFDWQAEYPAMVKEERPDFIVVAIGANDGQGFVVDKVVYPFGSKGWEQIYQQRVAAYLQMLESDGATVVWLGLPPMKDDAFDARIAWINRIDYSVVSASPHAIWVSTTGIVGDSSGRFRDFGEVHGRTEKLRQGDGIHLSDEGAALIAAKLLPWLAAQDLPAENASR